MYSKILILRFDKTVVQKPVVCYLVKDYDLTFNILNATILPRKEGIMVLELSGSRKNFKAGVTFLGHRDDVERLYRGFDVYVLASYREGFPRSAMEAAAMGLPVVATDIRGCRQVVADGETGVLVPARDGARLADALRRLVVDGEIRIRQGVAARVRALEHFDDRDVIATTLRTYETILDSSPSLVTSS